MCSPGINGEGELRGQPANPGSPGKMAVKTECVRVYFLVSYLVKLNFLSRTRTHVEPVDGFSQFIAHTTCFCPRTVLLGVATISEIIWVNSHKNSPNRA